MDRIELAVRQYERIAPRAGAQWKDVPIRRILVWLKDYVCPVAEQFAENVRFRKFARWSLDAISGVSVSSPARLIADVDRKLVAAAKALLEVVQDAAVTDQIRKQNPPERKLVRETVEISGEGSRRLDAVFDEVDSLPLKEAQVRRIAEHAYADLACLHDYFGPMGGLMPPEELAQICEQENTIITEGSLVPSLNPELHLIGDFVTRCMFQRIEIWLDCLTEYRKLCCRAIRAAGREIVDELKAETTTWAHLQEAIETLRKTFLTGRTVSLRDACIVLTQVYASFHPEPDLSWLGLPEPVIAYGKMSLKDSVENGRNLEVLDRIAAALGDLHEIHGSPEGNLEMAIQTGGLVIVKEPRAAYWEKEEIVRPWDQHGKPFELLTKLAEKARFGGVVTDKDLWNEPGARGRLSNLKGRLLKLVPRTLSMLIKPARPGVRLHFDAKKIYLIQPNR